jgi:hypothetical protein
MYEKTAKSADDCPALFRSHAQAAEQNGKKTLFLLQAVTAAGVIAVTNIAKKPIFVPACPT